MALGERRLGGLTIPLLVLQVGCASRAVPVGPGSRPATPSAGDADSCEALAQDEARQAGNRSVGRAFSRWWVGGTGSIADVVIIPLSIAVGVAGGSIDAGVTAHKNTDDRKAAYAKALESCRALREQSLGTENPETANRLRDLADRYAAQGRLTEAERLYARALAIEENVLAPDASDLATTLERYATLLRRMERVAEAEPMEARANAIRATRQEPRVEPRETPESPQGL